MEVPLRTRTPDAILTLSNKRTAQQTVQGRLSRREAFSQRFERLPVYLAGVVLFALTLRLLIMGFLIAQLPSNAVNYNDFGWESWEVGWTARSIFMGHGFSSPYLPLTGPTALVPPLFTYILAGCFKLFGLNTPTAAAAILSFNSLCSALTCIPLYFLTRNALTERAGRIAAFAWAIYPFAIYFSATRVWDYALTGLLFSCCLLVAQRMHLRSIYVWLGFGALYGVAVMSNPSIVSLLPFLMLFAMAKVWRRAEGTLKQRAVKVLVPALAATLAFTAACTPWTLRNERVMHKLFFVRDGFWAEFWAGNNGDTKDSNSAWTHPASNPMEMERYEALGEIKYMAEKHDLSVNFVKTHPAFFVVATVRRIVRFWTGYWSFSPSYLKYEPFDVPNVPFCLFLIWATYRGLKRWGNKNWRSLAPYAVALVLFPLPYYFTHSSMDYRQPIEPLLIVLVSVGLFGTGLETAAEAEDLITFGNNAELDALMAFEEDPEPEIVLA